MIVRAYKSEARESLRGIRGFYRSNKPMIFYAIGSMLVTSIIIAIAHFCGC